MRIVWLSRLSDATGLMAFFPLLTILTQATGILGLTLALHLYFIFTLAVASLSVWRLAWPSPGRCKVVSAVIATAALSLLASIYVTDLGGILFAYGLVAPMLVIGLYAHDVAKEIGSQRLDRFGGLAVLGSFLVVIRDPLISLLGLVLMSLGLGGISHHLRLVMLMLRSRESR